MTMWGNIFNNNNNNNRLLCPMAGQACLHDLALRDLSSDRFLSINTLRSKMVLLLLTTAK